MTVTTNQINRLSVVNGNPTRSQAMDGINQLDLITQRVLSLQVKTLTEELGQAQATLEQAQKRIAELEAPTAETKAE